MVESKSDSDPTQPPDLRLTTEVTVGQLLAASPDCIKLLDLTGNLLSISESGRKLLEIGDVSTLLHTCWTNWWKGASHTLAAEAVATAKNGGVGDFEAFAPTFAGTPKWWDVTVTPVRGKDGSIEKLLCIARDVTQRHMARDEAAERRDRLKSVITSAKDYAVISVDVNAIIDGWSTGAVDTFGWSEAEAVGQSIDLIWTKDDVEKGSPRKELLVAEKEGVAPDNRWHVRSDGRRIFIVDACRPVRNAAGELTGFVKVCRDETLRETAEQRLAAARFRSKAAQAAASTGTWMIDLAHRHIYADAGLAELYGMEPQVVDQPTPLARFTDTIPLSDRQHVLDEFEKFTGPGGGDTLSIEHALIVSNRDRHVLARGWVERNAAGAAMRVFGATVDVTDRKRAEEKQQLLAEQRRLALDAADLGWWHLDPITGHVIFDVRARAIFGIEMESLPYEKVIELMHVDDRQRVDAAVRDAVRPDDPLRYALEYRIIRPSDGQLRWVRAHGQAYFAGERAVRRFTSLVGTVEEVTAEKTYAEEREHLLAAERAARADAERQGRMKDDFLATLSHELRTPLNAIVGWSQILRSSGNDPDDIAEGLAVIDRNARAQTQIIEDILDMSRIISGKLRLNVERVDLGALVRSAVDTVQPAANAKGIQLLVLQDDAIGPVNGDPNRLNQIFWNLLSNAVKFTPKNGRVKIKLERTSSQLEVSVTDTGEGIDPEFVPFMFDRFRQADASITRKHGGLGLGLAIVKQLVELHGGSVRAQSPGKGQGATFIVSLPFTMVPIEDAAPEPVREVSNAGIPLTEYQAACKWINGLSIVVVDDEPDGRAVVQRLLEDCGATVRSAGSAEEAFGLIAAEVPSLLVSDIGMPGEDGYSLIRRIRSLPSHSGGAVPAIALTAYSRALDRVRVIESGFQMHVPKPVEPAELIVSAAAMVRIASGQKS